MEAWGIQAGGFEGISVHEAKWERSVKTIFNRTSFWFLVAALWMAGALAWAKPRISVHPLMAEQGRRGERWNDLFMRELAKLEIAMTPGEDVEAFLEERGGSCKAEIPCLRDLGYATQAHYILTGTMMRADTVYKADARVILVDGTEVKKVSVRVERVSKTSEEANALAVYEQLFAELNLESLPPHPPGLSLVPPTIIIEEKEKLVDRPVVLIPGQGVVDQAEVEEKLSREMSPMRKASYALLGVGAGTAAVGGVFALLANKDHRHHKKYLAEGTDRSIKADEDPVAAQKLIDRLSMQKTVAIVAFSVATAATATGLTLFFISPERYVKRSKVNVGLAPAAGGAVLSLQGTFP
jgi:hypothetical protein